VNIIVMYLLWLPTKRMFCDCFRNMWYFLCDVVV